MPAGLEPAAAEENYARAERGVREAVRAYHQVVSDLLQQTKLLVTAVDKLAGEERAGADGPPLTPRERHVLQLLAKGLTNRAIGRKLSISERTVKNHLQSVYAKLEVADRTGAVAKAIRLGVVT